MPDTQNNAALPTGTVTFLFSDIEGSTPLWEQHPQEMAEALAVHNSVLREAIFAHGGVVFKVVGDAFQSAFPTASQALKAALEAQRGLQAAAWNDLGPLKVRMGLHSGEAELDPGGDEYTVSHTKNRAARVMSAGYGGQVLLSQETAALVDRETRGDFELKDLGEHRLKGLSYPEHLYQATAPGLAVEFPPLETQAEALHNLPVELTSFIGRAGLIEQAGKLSRENRLVTLTGTGGVGKTRLALRVAKNALPYYLDGVWWVALAPVANPERIPQAIADALGVRLTEGDTIDELVAKIRRMQTLLVLDNCEHLVEDCARLSLQLLNECPKIHLLATSREGLNVAGERVLRIPSLAVPDPSETGGEGFQQLAELTSYESAQLLIARAQEASPEGMLSDADAGSLARICRRLDGIPLGLELAAARLRVLSPAQVAERLDDRFRLLAGGSRTALPHHQTLRAAVDWSYQLLEPKERLLFQRLSIFSGGWGLEAAEGICSGPFAASPQTGESDALLGIEPYEVLEILTALVDKSLVQVEQAPGKTARYYLLETLRQYGREKLLESGEAAHLHRRHMTWYVDWVEAGLPNQKNERLVAWMDALERDFDDLRAALEWAFMDNVGPQTALRLASSLYRYWWIRGNFNEAIDWLQKGLDAPFPQLQELVEKYPEVALQRARAQYCRDWVVSQTGQIVDSRQGLDQSIDLFRLLGPAGKRGLVEALAWKGMANLDDLTGQAQDDDSLEQAVEVGRTLGVQGRWELGMALWVKGLNHLRRNELEAAQLDAQESWSLFLQTGDRWNAGPVNILGGVAFIRKNLVEAQAFFEQALAAFQEARDKGGIASTYSSLTGVMIEKKDFKSAVYYFRESVKIWQTQGNRQLVAQYFKLAVHIRLILLLQNSPSELEHEIASLVALWSFAESYDPEITPPVQIDHFLKWWENLAAQYAPTEMFALSPEVQQEYLHHLQAALEAMGSVGLTLVFNEGQGLSFNQAMSVLPEDLLEV